MQTMKEQTMQEITKRFDRVTEMLEEILSMLQKPQYDNDRIILEVERFLKEIG